MSASLFDQVVATSGLSEVFAADTIERACVSVGVQPQQLRREDLARLATQLERTLKIFLGPDEARRRVEAISTLKG